MGRINFPTALKINLEQDYSFIEGCFYFIYRRERVIFHSENQKEFLNKLLAFSKSVKLTCFIKHPKEKVELNPLNCIIDYCDLKNLDYSIIATNENFNLLFNKPYQFLRDNEEEKKQQIKLNLEFDEEKIKLNIIEVRLNKPYRSSFRNLDNIIPVASFSKYNHPNNSIFNQLNNIKLIREINNRQNDFYDLEIKNETVSLHNEIKYYQERFYFEENINIIKGRFSSKDLSFMQSISKEKKYDLAEILGLTKQSEENKYYVKFKYGYMKSFEEIRKKEEKKI